MDIESTQQTILRDQVRAKIDEQLQKIEDGMLMITAGLVNLQQLFQTTMRTDVM